MGNGVGEIVFGFILILVFLVTLTIETIPIIWTGALISGIVLIIRGIYDSLKTEKPTRIVQPLSTSTISPRAVDTVCPDCGRELIADFSFCPSCGHILQRKCPNCGKALESKFKFCPNCGTSAVT